MHMCMSFPDDSYFHYLHEPQLNPEQFQKAREVMLHDLFVLARHGIVYTALADLFHNLEQIEDRADQGQYLPLIDIFRDGRRRGAGRLTGWIESVNYPNARKSGLADPDTDLVDRIVEHLSESALGERLERGPQGLNSMCWPILWLAI